MQQTTIRFSEETRGTVELKNVVETLREWKGQARVKFDTRSEYFSRICDMEVTWLTAINVSLGVVCALVLIVAMVAAIEHAPLMAAVTMAALVWLWWKISLRESKEGGEA